MLPEAAFQGTDKHFVFFVLGGAVALVSSCVINQRKNDMQVSRLPACIDSNTKPAYVALDT